MRSSGDAVCICGVHGAVGEPVGKVQIKVLVVWRDHKRPVTDFKTIQSDGVGLVEANDFAEVFPVAPGLRFAMYPRLKALSDRHLYLPRGCEVPEILKPICEASLDLSHVPTQWDPWVRLLASVYSGHTSAVSVMARFGSAARGDPLYEVGVVIGRLLRTVFLADYFVNPVFRREILRLLNRGEATNALKSLIYTGRVAGHQAKSQDEMQAVADALSLLANIVMAWNTVKMQAIFDRWAQSRSGAIPPELIARCAPTRTEGLNMRGILQFLIAQYAHVLMPSRVSPETAILEA
jgi:Tn3 transposase DDE domain-containing protein